MVRSRRDGPKKETLKEAVHRVAREELGGDVVLQRKPGVYEHFYDAAELDGVESKHYLANAFVVEPIADELRPDEQYASLQVFKPPFTHVHPYVRPYLDELDD